jgi:hypothetical protein
LLAQSPNYFFSVSNFSLPFETNIGDILKVRLGEYDVSTTAEPLRHEEINITEILIHPGFNNSTLVHDIALLKLEKPAKRKQVFFRRINKMGLKRR